MQSISKANELTSCEASILYVVEVLTDTISMRKDE